MVTKMYPPNNKTFRAKINKYRATKIRSAKGIFTSVAILAQPGTVLSPVSFVDIFYIYHKGTGKDNELGYGHAKRYNLAFIPNATRGCAYFLTAFYEPLYVSATLVKNKDNVKDSSETLPKYPLYLIKELMEDFKETLHPVSQRTIQPILYVFADFGSTSTQYTAQTLMNIYGRAHTLRVVRIITSRKGYGRAHTLLVVLCEHPTVAELSWAVFISKRSLLLPGYREFISKSQEGSKSCVERILNLQVVVILTLQAYESDGHSKHNKATGFGQQVIGYGTCRTLSSQMSDACMFVQIAPHPSAYSAGGVGRYPSRCTIGDHVMLSSIIHSTVSTATVTQNIVKQ